MYLHHYYDKTVGPFVSLSELPIEEARAVLENIRITKPHVQSAKRDAAYVDKRRNCERMLRERFIDMGGTVNRASPHYFVVGHSPWMNTWFDDTGVIKIYISEFDINTVSFTYGDSFPVFSDGPHKMVDKEWHKAVYMYDGIVRLIEKYGLPQDWNDDGAHGPSRYVEACVWDDGVVGRYR
jgi:hypothetical protein